METTRSASVMESTRSLVQLGSVDEAACCFLTLPDFAVSFRERVANTFRTGYLKGYYSSGTLLRFFSLLGSDWWMLDGCRILYEWNDEDRDGLTGMVEPVARFSQLPLAFFLHKFVSERHGAMLDEQVASLWARLMTPAAVVIVTSTPITITSSFRGEMLYAAGDGYKHDADRRNVFCWRDREWEHDRDKEQWTLVPVDDSNDKFYIVSRAFDAYLYATNYAKGEVRGGETCRDLSRVFLWRCKSLPDPTGVWVFVPLHRQPNGLQTDAIDEFALYNPHLRKFLYSMDHCHDEHRRYAFTERHAPNSFPWTNERKWTLAPALPKK